jgi:predicted RNA-binding protein with PUA-like domain
LFKFKNKMNYWLLKSEPFKYPWKQMLEDKITFWDGVRSYPARIHLNAMQVGDLAFFYHSNEGLEIVGTVKIVKTAYPDPTSDEEGWVCVDVKAEKSLKKPVTLKQIKANTALSQMALIKLSRLSVSPVTAAEWETIMAMGEEK